jgi:uncharacterized protein (TIGR03086 family)
MPTRHGSAVVTLPSDREILITRSFEAPLDLVWQALTEPRHVLRWWGPDWCPLVKCEIDLRVGGTWRYVARDAEGTELGWHGTYRAIEAPRRIVSSEVFEGFPDAESENTMTLNEEAGVTTLRTLVLHSSREHRDGHISSGMEGGMQVTFNRLEDLLASFDSPAERFRRVAGRFTQLAEQVPAGAWDDPAPCEGWVARDVVRHMVEWMSGFLSAGGLVIPPGPSVDDDPVGAWTHLADGIQALLDDPEIAAREVEIRPVGRQTVEKAIDSFFLGDVFIHTWDLARATGLDEALDTRLAAEMYAGMQPLDDLLRQSGHYGPKVDVPDDADVQTKLLAFTGRHP